MHVAHARIEVDAVGGLRQVLADELDAREVIADREVAQRRG